MSRQMGTVGQRYVCQMTNGSTCKQAPGRSAAAATHADLANRPSVCKRTEAQAARKADARQLAARPLTVSQIISRREVCLQHGAGGAAAARWEGQRWGQA